jgi:hypothetical protein
VARLSWLTIEFENSKRKKEAGILKNNTNPPMSIHERRPTCRRR